MRETLRKHLRNIIIYIKYFEIPPMLKTKQFYLNVFGFFIVGGIGFLFAFSMSVYIHLFFIVIVIAIIGRNVLPEEQWNWIEKRYLKIWKRVTDEWGKLLERL